MNPVEYATTYGPLAQRLLWNRLGAADASPSDPEPAVHGLAHVIITAPIPASQDRSDAALLKSYDCLRSPLPLTELPEATEIRAIGERLAAEFPWAARPVQDIVMEALARKAYGAREMGGNNVLLVGPPGCGKSRLARRLAEEFRLQFLTLPLGGTGDPKVIAGTSRGWAGGQPSPLITAMMTMRSANPLVLLDEIDKVTDSGQHAGPAPVMLLLGLLEKENARRWRDLFLQTTCDVSKVVWVATANTTRHMVRPLLDRFRVVAIDAPQRDHLRAVLPHVARDLEADWGLPAGTLPELPPTLLSSRVRTLRDLRQLARAWVTDWAAASLMQSERH